MFLSNFQYKIKCMTVCTHIHAYLKGEHCAGQVSSLDFRHVSSEHFISVCTLCVQPVALARPRPTCSACSLLSLGLKHPNKYS